jgi:hypothetical protein
MCCTIIKDGKVVASDNQTVGAARWCVSCQSNDKYENGPEADSVYSALVTKSTNKHCVKYVSRCPNFEKLSFMLCSCCNISSFSMSAGQVSSSVTAYESPLARGVPSVHGLNKHGLHRSSRAAQHITRRAFPTRARAVVVTAKRIGPVLQGMLSMPLEPSLLCVCRWRPIRGNLCPFWIRTRSPARTGSPDAPPSSRWIITNTSESWHIGHGPPPSGSGLRQSNTSFGRQNFLTFWLLWSIPASSFV